MKKVLYYFLLVPICLFAQIKESDTLKLKADLSLTGFWQAGNVETLIFRAQSNVSFKAGKKLVYKTQNSYVYQEFGKEKADEDILSLNFLYFNPERKIYPLLLGFVSTNFRREIDARYIAGAGVSFQLFKKKKNWLKFSISSEYEETNFDNNDFNFGEYDGMQSINTFRATLWVNGKYYLFKDKVIFSHESYFQPSLKYGNNYRWRSDINLEFPVWKFLNFKINYLNTFESVVIQGQKQGDRFLTFGFTLKSY
ncbi:MAG: DUF481 domain-containing protein [Eudoraea sp.]|nr:DUF481 domain-containing protein [Eudoraea sp.]MBT8222412.1 DUF481 domain-containing protein [Eudoraea sp.]NNK70664.1 DUF481 domain-containing protein [Flavobacteriaceae bacterium]